MKKFRVQKREVKAFTLIELLVVVSIIGVLSVLAVVNMNAAQAKSRDADRKKSLTLVASALNMYYSDNKSYPDTSKVFKDIDPTLQSLVNGKYLQSFPADPNDKSDFRYASNGSDYKLVATSPESISASTFDGSNRCTDAALKKLAGDFCDNKDGNRFQISSSETAVEETW